MSSSLQADMHVWKCFHFLIQETIEYNKNNKQCSYHNHYQIFFGGGGQVVSKKSQNVFPLLEQCLMFHTDKEIFQLFFKYPYCEGGNTVTFGFLTLSNNTVIAEFQVFLCI